MLLSFITSNKRSFQFQLFFKFRNQPIFPYIILKQLQKKTMNKENKFLIISSKKGCSSDKEVSRSKLRSSTSENVVKNHYNQKNSGCQLTESKHGSNQTSYDYNKKKISSFQKSHTKFYGKLPMKLRIVSETHTRKQDSKNSTEAKEFLYQVQNIIEREMIPQLIDNKVVQKCNLKQVIVRPQTLVLLIKRIIFFGFHDKQTFDVQELSCISLSLSKMQTLFNLQKNQKKRLRNGLFKSIPSTVINASMSQEIKMKQSQLIKLGQMKTALVEELKQLRTEKQMILNYYQEKKKEIETKNYEINQSNKKIADYERNKASLLKEVRFYEAQLDKCKQSYESILYFVQNESKNQHVKHASKDYKKIQQEIYDYASYLQANELASSQSYESIPFKNQCFIIANIQNSLKEINKEIIHNDSISPSQKCKMMRNFILKAHGQFKKKDAQYEKLIDFKTKCIRKFISMMKKWIDNWSLKQEYLVGLRSQFAIDNSTLTEIMKSIFHNQLCNQCQTTARSSYESMVKLYQKIEENYKLGNSFY